MTAIAARAAAIRSRRHRGLLRLLLVLLAALVLIGALTVAGLMLGAADLSADAMVRGLLGIGSRSENLIVQTLRLPRIEAALLAGAAFGLAGAVFQSVLRNPLASPDILGISSGASLGAVIAVLGLGWSGIAVSLTAFAGAGVVALLIWALAWRQGLHGIRFVLVGVGLAYLCASLISWLLSQADVREAQPVLLWTVGSVADVRGGLLDVLGWLVLGFSLLVAVNSRPLRVLAATNSQPGSGCAPTAPGCSSCSQASGSSPPRPASPVRSPSSRCSPRPSRAVSRTTVGPPCWSPWPSAPR